MTLKIDVNFLYILVQYTIIVNFYVFIQIWCVKNTSYDFQIDNPHRRMSCRWHIWLRRKESSSCVKLRSLGVYKKKTHFCPFNIIMNLYRLRETISSYMKGSFDSESCIKIPTVKFNKLFINGQFVDSISGTVLPFLIYANCLYFSSSF